MRRDIPGYCGRYFADTAGNIYRRYASTDRKLKPTINKNGVPVIRLQDHGGVRKEHRVHRLIAETFMGAPPQGHVVYHKNGDKKYNALHNLGYMTPAELGRKTGHQSRRKAVVKTCPAGTPVEIYRSARQAAKENFMSYQTIIDRCNGKVKGPIAPDGYVYTWEES